MSLIPKVLYGAGGERNPSENQCHDEFFLLPDFSQCEIPLLAQPNPNHINCVDVPVDAIKNSI